MAPKAKKARKHWPQNLYRDTAGTFWYRDPVTKEPEHMGMSEAIAIRNATRINAAVVTPRSPMPRDVLPQTGESEPVTDEDGLLTADSISRAAQAIPQLCGVYFLIASGEIIYIGQSIDCGRRISEHIRDPEKTFDSYHVIECSAETLNEMEQRYIVKFRPILNIYGRLAASRHKRSA